MNTNNPLVDAITEGIRNKKGEHIVVADLTKIDTAPCAYFVICQGNSPQQVEAIADAIWDEAHQRAGEKPAAIAGRDNAQWVAMDYGNVMAHIFLPEARTFYDLENLWDDAKLTTLPDEA